MQNHLLCLLLIFCCDARVAGGASPGLSGTAETYATHQISTQAYEAVARPPPDGAYREQQVATPGYFSSVLAKAVSLILSLDQALFVVVNASLCISLLAVLISSCVAVPLGLLVGLTSFTGRGALLGILNTLMAMPTVIVGLLLYGVLRRQGVFGDYSLLYTPAAIVIGQTILILPIIWNLSIAAVSGADPRLRLTCRSLGAGFWQQARVYAREVRFALIAAVVAGFGRAIGEVGIAVMLGGNIEGYTRTMTTTIALETSKGNFEFAIAIGIVLLLVALVVNLVLQWFQGAE